MKRITSTVLIITALAGCAGGGVKLDVEVYRYMFYSIYNFLMNYELCEECGGYQNGDALNDYGDGTAYGPAFFYEMKWRGIADDRAERLASEISQRGVELIDELSSQGVFAFLGANSSDINMVSEAMIAPAGLIVAYRRTGNATYLNAVKSYLKAMSTIASPQNPGMLNFILQLKTLPYGPTTLLGGLAAFYFDYPPHGRRKSGD